MHNKTKLLIFASLLLAACSTDPMQEIPNRGDSAPEIETSGKICNTSDDAVAGSLIVKFGEDHKSTAQHHPYSMLRQVSRLLFFALCHQVNCPTI